METVYELMLEPWILQSCREYLDQVCPDKEVSALVESLIKLTFTRYQLTE